MSTALFRSEVMEAQGASHLGSIQVAKNPSFFGVAGMAVVLAICLTAFAIWGQVSRKAKLSGFLTPELGTLSISSASGGVVRKLMVREGDVVALGDPIAQLQTDRISDRGEAGQLVSESLNQRIAAVRNERGLRQLQSQQRYQQLSDRVASLLTEKARAEGELDLVLRRVAISEKSLQRQQQLAKDGFVSEAQVQQRQDETLDIQSRADAAKRSVAAVQREIQSVQDELSTITLQSRTEQTQFDRTETAISQEIVENNARLNTVLTATHAGKVTAIHAQLGATLLPGQALATLVPEAEDKSSRLEAHLYATSRKAGFVEAGQIVWIRYAAYPYQKFGMARGVVMRVSVTPVNQQDLPVGQASSILQAAQSNEPLYRIQVKLDKQDIQAYGDRVVLRPGMSLEADVVQDRRALWEWMFEPLLAVRAQLNANERRTTPAH